ncbi:hypothetical protein, partial [Acinetobacter baumannii]
ETDTLLDSDRKTARILTGSPFSVNTAKGWFPPLECRFYQASKEFKQTFVLDLPMQLYIMRPL